MQIRDNQGKLIGKINNSFTQDGRRIITNTLYDPQGNPTFQNISVRDNEGKVHTTTVLGGKLLP
jgi:hypothetical protein